MKLEGIMRVSRPGMLVTFEPHLHSSGKRMCVDAIYPIDYSGLPGKPEYDVEPPTHGLNGTP